MAGYVRQSSAEIVDTLTIDAVDLNNEFDALVSAFVNTTGHKHDGTAANGPVIGLIGDANLATPLNKILTDTANAELEFYINVGAAATEQFKVSDGLIVPSVNNDIDLGTTALKFKDAFFDGTVTLDGLVVSGSTAITSIDTDLTTVSANDDTLASAKAIKAAIAAIPEGDLTSIVAGSGLTGTDLSGPIPTLNVISGNGLTANADNIVIDTSITVDKTTAQILTNKTLTSPVLNGTLSGTAFLDEDTLSSDSAIAVASQQSIKAYIDNNVSSVTPSSTTTFTNKTIDANGTGNSISNLEVADLASGVLDTDLTAVAATDTTLASAKAIKTYVDSQSHSNVTASSTTTFTNKTIDVDATGNSITNLANANIKAAAAIDASKIADGSVSDAEFQRLDGLTSDIQTQLDLKAALASPALTGNPTAPTQVAGNNSTRLATTAYVDNSTASRDQLGELTDVTLASEADANYFIYDNAASVWKNKAISGAFTSTKEGVTTLASGIDATKIADGTVTDSEFQFINSLTSNAQTQIDTKQATIDSSNRLNANLVGDGSVDNTEFGYLNGVTSDIQAQISAKASAGFAVAMAIAL
tara:strand:- start:197 stop:1957 length:1761 start_codon:yes stop_codon:yes gene_type:complete